MIIIIQTLIYFFPALHSRPGISQLEPTRLGPTRVGSSQLESSCRRVEASRSASTGVGSMQLESFCRCIGSSRSVSSSLPAHRASLGRQYLLLCIKITTSNLSNILSKFLVFENKFWRGQCLIIYNKTCTLNYNNVQMKQSMKCMKITSDLFMFKTAEIYCMRHILDASRC